MYSAIVQSVKHYGTLVNQELVLYQKWQQIQGTDDIQQDAAIQNNNINPLTYS
jgi:hypothetical protein